MKKLLSNQLISYLFFGGLATLVYLLVRICLFQFFGLSGLTASLVANLVAILFAFVTNDRFVFRQERQGWQTRFVKFFTARISTLILDAAIAYLFIDLYPQIVGQFVNHNLQLVNAIVGLASQVLIIIGNYFISKLLVFTSTADH